MDNGTILIGTLNIFQEWRRPIIFRRQTGKFGGLSPYLPPYTESSADNKEFSQTDNKKNFVDKLEKWGISHIVRSDLGSNTDNALTKTDVSETFSKHEEMQMGV